ncbi:MAG: NAD(P)H-hydrate dehydratase, partial [Pseudomonadota bacterium]
MKLVINSPDLWRDQIPRPHVDGHKYHRGHVAIYGAPELTGATRLAAMACSRTGAGLVTVIARENADIYRITLPPDIMVRGEMPEKASVLLCGSGGVLPDQMTEALDLSDRVGRVFDADALQAEIILRGTEHPFKLPQMRCEYAPFVQLAETDLR